MQGVHLIEIMIQSAFGGKFLYADCTTISVWLNDSSLAGYELILDYLSWLERV